MNKYFVFILLLISTGGFAQLKVASIFSDNMIIQRDKRVAVWGTSDSKEKIKVSFNGVEVKTKSDSEGNWKVYLKPMEACIEGKELIVSTKKNTLKFKNILVGDVWIAGGQSNMNKNVAFIKSISDDVIKKSNNPLIRFINVPNKVSTTPLENIDAEWQISDEKSILKISAIGAVFAQRLQKETNIPIGILAVNMGSTSVECWVSNDMLKIKPFAKSYKYWEDLLESWDDGAYKPYLKKLQKKKKDLTKETLVRIDETRTLPSGAYNAMLNPVTPYTVKGVLWRQGEANSSRAAQYQSYFTEMVKLWRTEFKDDNLPFVLIGLPSYGKIEIECGGGGVPEIREAQQLIAKSDKDIYYVSIIDLNDIKKNRGNIHPRNKYLAGTRTSKLVEKNIYKLSVDFSQSNIKNSKVEGNKIIVEFDNVGSGIFTGKLKDLKGNVVEKEKSEYVNNFCISSSRNNFVPAKARVISKNKIEVWSDNVFNPKYVRYAWKSLNLDVNLYNGSGQVIPAFRTDKFELSTKGKVKPKISLVRPLSH